MKLRSLSLTAKVIFLTSLNLTLYTILPVQGQPCASQPITRWNHLTPAQRQALDLGGVVSGFHTGFCTQGGAPILVSISAGPSPASGFGFLNNEAPGVYGTQSFDNRRELAGAAGNQYCFTFSEPVAMAVHSFEHSHFVRSEKIVLTALNNGNPVPLKGAFNLPAGALTGNNTHQLTFSADGFEDYGLGWSAHTDGAPLTMLCVDYSSSEPSPGREPFSIELCAERCLFDDPVACTGLPTPPPSCSILPEVLVTKNFVGVDLAASGIPGHLDVTYQVTMTNLSSTALLDAFLDDDLVGFFGGAFMGLSSPPQIVAPPVPTGAALNPNFNGFTDINILGPSFIKAGASFTVQFTVEIDPMGNPELSSFLNQAVGGGTDGNQLNVSDLSNLASNPLVPGSPVVVLPAQDLTVIMNPNGSVPIPVEDWLDDNGGAVFSVPGCEPVLWTNDFDPADFSGCGPIAGSVTVTFTAVNACGMSFSTTATYTIVDDMPPMWLTIAHDNDLHLDCSDPDAPQIIQDWLEFISTTCISDVSIPLTVTNDFDGLEGPCVNGEGNEVVTFTATDACGNSADLQATIFFTDTTAPVFLVEPMNVHFDCVDGAQDAFDEWLANNGFAEATDFCLDFAWSTDPPNPTLDLSDPCNASTTVTFLATDDCGNVDSRTATFSVGDTLPPTLTPLDSLFIGLNSGDTLIVDCDDIPAFDLSDVSASDNCDDSLETTIISALVPLDCETDGFLQWQQVVWSATDDCGNTGSFTLNILVQDTVPPTLTPLDSLFTGLNSGDTLIVDCDAIPTFDLSDFSASDNCDDSLETTIISALVPLDCETDGFLQWQQVVWSATDDCGNTGSFTLNILVQDTLPPTLTLTDSIFQGFSSGDTVIVNGCLPFSLPSITVSDNCDPDPTGSISSSAMPLECTPEGFVEWIQTTWTVADHCNNTTEFTLNFLRRDTVPPQLIPQTPNVLGLSSGDTLILPCDSLPPFVPEDFRAVDNCTDSVEVLLSAFLVTFDCEATGFLEKQQFTWIATDDCGLQDFFELVVLFVDTVPPEFIFVPPPDTNQCPGDFVFGDPLVVDCSGFTLTHEDVQVGDGCPAPSTITRIWTATDLCGNTSTASQTVTNIPPPFTLAVIAPPDTSFACHENPQFGAPEIIIECPVGLLELTFVDSPAPGDCSVPFSITRTWTARDQCGNEASDSQTITLGPDTQPPVFDPANPDTLTVDCAAMSSPPLVTDSCGTVSLSFTDSTLMGDCSTGLLIHRIWTATDLCGNAADFPQVLLTGPDTVPPVFTFVPETAFFDCEDSLFFLQATAMDICTDVEITFTDTVIGVPDCDLGIGWEVRRIWKATDACGNMAFDTSRAIVIPGLFNGNPIAFIHLPADRELACGEMPDFGQALAASICGPVSISYEDSTEPGCMGTRKYIRTWTATDTCGHAVSAVTTLTRPDDTEPPVFSFLPEDKEMPCGAVPQFDNPAALDECSGVTMSIETSVEVDDCTQGWRLTRRWTATDGCGNVAAVEQTLSYPPDEEPPLWEDYPAYLEMSAEEFENWQLPDPQTLDCSPVDYELAEDIQQDCDARYHRFNWRATDLCGNSSDHLLEVKITDAAFALEVRPPASIDCGESAFLLAEAFNASGNVAYEWSFVDNPFGWTLLGNPYEPTIQVVAGEGAATLLLTAVDEGGCSAAVEVPLECQTTTAAEELPGVQALRVFPNPFRDELHIALQSPAETELQYTLRDLLGRPILSGTWNLNAGKQHRTLRTRKLPAGAYFLVLKSGNGTRMVKVVKE